MKSVTLGAIGKARMFRFERVLPLVPRVEISSYVAGLFLLTYKQNVNNDVSKIRPYIDTKTDVL